MEDRGRRVVSRGLVGFPLALALVLAPAALSTAQAGEGGAGFLGLQIGQAAISEYELENESRNLDDTDIGWKVFVGYRLVPYLALEGGYVDLGALEADGTAFGGFTDEVEASAWEVNLVGILPLGRRVELFANAGFFRWDQEVRYKDSAETFQVDASGDDVTYGAGINFPVDKDRRIGVHAAWSFYPEIGDELDTGRVNDRELISVGLLVRLGD